MPLTAKDIMTTEVITVTPATPLVEFARLCAEDRISGAPVCQVDGKLVGIVSKTDLVEHILDEDPRWAAQQHRGSGGDEPREVQDIMRDDVLTVAPSTPVHEVARLMAEDRVHRAVVVDRERVAGVITSLDMLKHYPAPTAKR